MSAPKRWVIAPAVKPEFANQFPEINPLILRLLYNRGIDSQKKVDEFLLPDYGENLYDPFLLKDMEKAVKRIFQAVEKKEKILVYGDYDADGVTSSAILVEAITALGAPVEVYIPYRETEGYGLNQEAAGELIKQKIQLLITVDCGISNVAEVETLNQGGVDVIITDHHHPPEVLPKPFATINPHLEAEYPFHGLAGCGVAYKLVQALVLRQADYKVNQLETGFEKWLLDLVAIGTIADMQPVLSENRVLVKYGLIVLQKTKRLGLLKLIELMSSNLTEIDERVVGWQIAPRLNAAGRLNHASSAYQLLITEDLGEAQKLADELNQTNRDRQQLTDKINTEAKVVLGEVKDQKILVVIGEGWPTGLVGLVAGRLTDEYHRPSLVISRYNGEIIGSGRSIEAFNIIEALEQCRPNLSRFGGHAQACGFTVKDEKNLAEFKDKIIELAQNQLTEQDIVPVINIDLQVSLEDIDWPLVEELEKFKPFGEDNLKPKFLAKDLTVTGLQSLGADGKHMRLMVKHNTSAIRKTIGFCFGSWCAKLKAGDKVDLVFEVDINEWNGNKEIQLKIVDLALGG
ncbi:MAG: single-stranded-DNA-specific exonuclease RecJ [Candidatus Buchananbacteria bacterium RIFCSPLOWO2_02_FULL_46_11b]|uniref:Single-stranded-DNA-specific exonuclease RecJ n=1 Tax=Candidatus Buchananbacteria bacterium RIFCSPLOWO2_02_FULL_46_11b TaxID=1797548 RepID=A0A1G1YYU7_9BACT|nr:MAG: single-stranded-DNA-specific exonuclease RecJ [Candidatus Buchananbacteria bacterium RIFCSPLOWO2_02_FULL_46_11b]